MTVTQEVVFVRGVGNGTTKVFSVPFSAEGVPDIQATVGGSSVVVSAYDANAKTVTLQTAPANGAAVEIWRSTPLAQTLDANNQNALPPENIEVVLDRLVRSQQEGREAFTRAVKVGRGQTAPDLPAPNTGKVLEWGANNTLVNSTVSASGVKSSADAAAVSATSAESAATAAESARDQASAHRLNASNSATSAAQSAAEAAASAASASAIQVADGSITTAKIAPNAVTQSQIAANAVGNSELQNNAVDTDEIAPRAVTADKIAAGVIPDSVFVGAIVAAAMATVPTGYLECNGAAISRTTYADLFAAIGTTYGNGDGSTTFNLPDLRGEFLRGWDNSRGVDSGRSLGSAQGDELRSHNHALSVPVHYAGGSSTRVAAATGAYYGAVSMSTSSAGGSETRPRNVAMMYWIKY